MARTEINTQQIGDGEVTRADLNIANSSKAVIRRIIAGTGIQINSTGVDTGTGDVTINVVGSGDVMKFQVEIDFGDVVGEEETNIKFTVADTSITTGQKIFCQVANEETDDHTNEEAMCEEIMAYPQNIIAGTSFDINVIAPNGTWGKYLINIMY